MTWTKADLEAIDAALAGGDYSALAFADRTYSFRSIDELIELRDRVARERSGSLERAENRRASLAAGRRTLGSHWPLARRWRCFVARWRLHLAMWRGEVESVAQDATDARDQVEHLELLLGDQADRHDRLAEENARLLGEALEAEVEAGEELAAVEAKLADSLAAWVADDTKLREALAAAKATNAELRRAWAADLAKLRDASGSHLRALELLAGQLDRADEDVLEEVNRRKALEEELAALRPASSRSRPAGSASASWLSDDAEAEVRERAAVDAQLAELDRAVDRGGA